MDKVQVSRAVARLMAAGRLERRLSPDDRRRSTLRLTDAGEETYGRIVPLARDYERRLMDRLPREDRTKLMGMLETISLPGEDRG
ncbi:MAG: MarR family winged helix-turn-helix transcriptional regulator [Minwuia sp.]|uniref:MarR family winged helix-turn-helix transcriptional regulator n=1 Tax=Minwuia sp. TaxID=2493630 RepID=UPI003A8685AF